MKEKEPHGKRRFKGLMIVEIIVCYMALLTVVSHICGPEKYRVIPDLPLRSTQSFSSFRGETISENDLQMDNPVPGSPIGYSTLVSLEGLDRIQVECWIDCPAESVGNVLHVDLYEPAYGYDRDEQELFLSLKEGRNEINFLLNPGENHPENALLRFFTLDSAGYTIQDIVISPMRLAPKVSKGMAGTVIVCFVLLAGTGLTGYLKKKHTAYGEDE